MNTAAPTIAADVTVTLDDAVARELLSLGGVVEGDLAVLAATRRNSNHRPARRASWRAARHRRP